MKNHYDIIIITGTDEANNEEFFENVVNQTSNQEGLLILAELNEIINRNEKFSKILYTWKKIDYELRLISRNPNLPKPDYIILTDDYLNNPKYRNRAHRILQIARNHGIKTKVVNSETNAGVIVKSYGGLICFTKKK